MKGEKRPKEYIQWPTKKKKKIQRNSPHNEN
jgi:hypothetical protein